MPDWTSFLSAMTLGPGAGERDGGLCSVLLFDGASFAHQGGLCGRGGVSAGAAGGGAARMRR